MAALTADRAVPAHKQVQDSALFADFPVAASTVIYRGGFVGFNAAGNLVMHAPEDLSATQGTHRFVGIAQEAIASQTSAGDKNCRVQLGGYFSHALASATIADVGKAVYVTDSQTIAKEGVCTIDVIGRIVHLESAGIVVIKLQDFGTVPGTITRIINDFDVTTVGSTVLILHETENHNGAWMGNAAAVVTTAIDTSSTAGVITFSHTTATETTLGLTLTFTDNVVALDLISSNAAGSMFGPAAADADNMILVPADVAIMAVLTTQGTTGAGVADVVAKIQLL